jgi:hypothetical protein
MGILKRPHVNIIHVPRTSKLRTESLQKNDPSTNSVKRMLMPNGRKNGMRRYGYKNEPKVDADSKLITECVVVPANIHNNRHFEDLIDPLKDNVVYGDSAFVGAEIAANIKAKARKATRKITR